MNRFGVKITPTYWRTMGLTVLAVFIFSTLSARWPSFIWTVLTIVVMILLGKKAAVSCSDKRYGFPIGRAFLWSYISYIVGRGLALALTTALGWHEEIPMPDYSYSFYSTGAENPAFMEFMKLLQSPYHFGHMIIYMYAGVVISLFTATFIKKRN